MNVRTRSIVAVLGILPVWAICGGSGSSADAAERQAPGRIGKPAPDFALKDVNGKEYKLADYKGKVVVLEWTNHRCPVVNGYHKEGAMKKTLAKFAGKPVAWLAVDSSSFCQDKIDKIKEWAVENKVEYPILLDAPGRVGRAFGAKTTPHMFVIDQKGILAYKGALDDDPMGTKESARNYVDEAITALLNGSTVATSKTKPVGCSVKYAK